MLLDDNTATTFPTSHLENVPALVDHSPEAVLERIKAELAEPQPDAFKLKVGEVGLGGGVRVKGLESGRAGSQA